jgi:hypothetical protein
LSRALPETPSDGVSGFFSHADDNCGRAFKESMMNAGKLPVRDHQKARGSILVTKTLAAVPVAIVLFLGSTSPAEAQRPGIGGRRWRSAPQAPRTQPPPAGSRPSAAPGSIPSLKAPSGPEQPATAKGQSRGSTIDPSKDSKAAKNKGTSPPPPGKKQGDDRPQTTGASPPGRPQPALAATSAATPSILPVWDGPSPFSDAWRADHPGAWRPDDGTAEVVLAGGSHLPTAVEPRAVDLARWTATDVPAGGGDTHSVLQASAASEPAGDSGDDLVVFPGADGTLPIAAIPSGDSLPSGQATAEPAEQVAADGTVSVLVKEPAPSAPDAVTARADRTSASVSQDEWASPWLPLGAFAAVPTAAGGEVAPHVFLELSLHRDGTVRGNYFDAVSDAVHPVSGRFDRETGSLIWRIGGAGAEFSTTVDGLAKGRVEATVRRGTTERTWQLIALR